MTKPYYTDDLVTLYHGDWRDCREAVAGFEVAISDPPYGIGYRSGHWGKLARAIANDESTDARDSFLLWWHKPALLFGSWKAPHPVETRMVLVWDSKGALGMGDLTLPWKPAHQQIYVLGRGFVGDRTTDVLRFAPVQAMASNGRTHPHEKPIALMRALVTKCPPSWRIVDPFCGTGATLIAAKSEGRRCIGSELEESYCEIAAKRLSQGELPLGGAA